jgi:phosphatidylserine decarboxylase
MRLFSGLFLRLDADRMRGLVAREGMPFLLLPLIGALICLALGWLAWGGLLVLVGFGFGSFFRDPERAIPQQPGLIVSPADGRVVRLRDSARGTVISIFLSVFNVHVNRAPIGGSIRIQEYRPGKFLMAFDDRASVENEQMMWKIEGEASVTFCQIAGWVARRIVAWKQQGDTVKRGDRIGLIKFGSRVDITIPASFAVVVEKGDRVRGGSSILARLESNSEGAED